ncbi:MAG: CYTH domain-containing protein [Candidatus Woykebacteria bacterium]
MKKEIERRFLVIREKLPKLTRGQKIVQGYLSTDPVVRVRVKNSNSYLTLKFRKEKVNHEFEYKIPLRDAQKLLTECKFKIEKNRYLFKLNGNILEIDFFEGENSGLIITEVEFPNLNTYFQKPLWLGKEITDDEKYFNANLAQRPYLRWGTKIS